MVIEGWLVFKISKYGHKTLWLVFKIFKHCRRALWVPAHCIKYPNKLFIALFTSNLGEGASRKTSKKSEKQTLLKTLINYLVLICYQFE